MTNPKFQPIMLTPPQHIQPSTPRKVIMVPLLVIRCTLCCANICERLMSLNPSRKASTPPICQIFFGERGKATKPARTRVTVVKEKNIDGRVTLELLIHETCITIPLQWRLRPLSKMKKFLCDWYCKWGDTSNCYWSAFLIQPSQSPTSLKRFTKRSRCLGGRMRVELSWNDVKKHIQHHLLIVVKTRGLIFYPNFFTHFVGRCHLIIMHSHTSTIIIRWLAKKVDFCARTWSAGALKNKKTYLHQHQPSIALQGNT